MVLQYLPLQTRARHRRSHRPHVPMLMRGTPSTMRSPPHQSRQACVPHRTSHPPAKGRSPQLRHCTGKVASAGAGQLRRATRPAAGHARVPPPTPPAPPPQPHTTRPTPTTTRPEERRTSCRQQPALHHAMQQRCHNASASAPSPSWPPMPRSRRQRTATARREKVQLCIREQSFYCSSETEFSSLLCLLRISNYGPLVI